MNPLWGFPKSGVLYWGPYDKGRLLFGGYSYYLLKNPKRMNNENPIFP